MADKPQDLLVSFMKKQASTKPSKQNNVKKSTASLKTAEVKKDKDGEEIDTGTEEMTDEEKLEDAKKESRSKVANTDQTEMIKKLILESVAKYTLLITLLVVVALGVIKLGPVFFEFLHGLFFKVLLGKG